MKHLSNWPTGEEVSQALEHIKHEFLKKHPNYSGTGMYDNGSVKGLIIMQDQGSLFECSATIKAIERLGLFWMVKKFSKTQDYGNGLEWNGGLLIDTDIVLDVYYPYYN